MSSGSNGQSNSSSSANGRSVLGHAGLSMLGPTSSSPQGTERPSSRPSADTKLSEPRPSDERRKSATDMLGEDDDIPMCSLATDTARRRPSETSNLGDDVDTFKNEQSTPSSSKLATPTDMQRQTSKSSDAASEDSRSFSKRSDRASTDIGADRYVRRVSGLMGKKLTIDCKITDMLGGKNGDESDNDDGCLSLSPHPAEEICTPGLVASVWGKTTGMDMFQPYFSGKPMNFDNNPLFSVLPHSIGVHCQRGQKPHIPNQDDFFVLERNEWLLFGVLDGHGNEGHQISHCAQQRLPSGILHHLKNKEDWEDSCCHAFKEVVNELDQKDYAKDSGSTASVALLSKASSDELLRLRCAFVGDSSIVYGKRPKTGGSWECTQLSDNHKPDRPDERIRIEACGGEVKAPTSPKYPHRLVCDSGGLAMSRSLGDLDAVKFGLSNEPEITPEITLEKEFDHIILICSDGIWDMIDPAAAVQLVAKFQPEDSQRAAEKLAIKAQSRWQEQEKEIGVVDDITVILVRPSFVSS